MVLGNLSSSRAVLTACCVLCCTPAGARVTHVQVDETKPATRLPNAPDYEIVTGVFSGELDPDDPHNRIITDLALAPRNGNGRVDYKATFQIARPINADNASGVLIYDVPNRGNGWVSADPDGHIRVVSGWQGDIPAQHGVQTAFVPTAVGPGGSAITGPVLAQFTKVSAGRGSIRILRGIGRPVPAPLPATLDPTQAHLWQTDAKGRKVAIPADAWSFGDCGVQPFPGKPDPAKLCLRDGFDFDSAYTLVYQGKDPQVLGVGFAATRDFVSFLRSGKPDEAGQSNPAGGKVRWTIGTGTSQSGNFLRSLIHLGFNTAENGSRVFDGINPNIAARQVPLNIRFGVPGGAAGAFEPGSEGTLWWGPYTDTARKAGTSSLLDRCNRDNTCPKVVETLGSAEFWGLRLSPNFVGTDARRDIPLPPNVRRYYFPSTAHGGSFGKGFSPNGDGRKGSCLLMGNPNPVQAQLRVAQRALVDWVRFGTAPPASSYPTKARGELVAPNNAALRWPRIPGAPLPSGKINPFIQQDFGKELRSQDLSGSLLTLPPTGLQPMPSLVPRLDRDGNEVAGVRSVHLQVPLGTYTGWNVETEGVGKGGGCGFEAGFIPFARTRAERLAKHDPRRSLEERYGSHDRFVRQVRAVVAAEIRRGWLLPADADRIIADAQASDVLR